MSIADNVKRYWLNPAQPFTAQMHHRDNRHNAKLTQTMWLYGASAPWPETTMSKAVDKI
jgi:hypothetical protein